VIRAGLRDNPEATLALLEDPNNFPFLSPPEREELKTAARDQWDDQRVANMRIFTQLNPTGAALTIGVIADPTMISTIFDEGIIWKESGGDPAALSPAGAMGVAQLMPGTARILAQQFGRPDVAAMSTSELREFFAANPDINRAWGLEYFRQQLEEFNGNPALAMAAYNAGPGNARRWAAMVGPDATAEELLAVIDIEETRNYIAAIYDHLGADLSARFTIEDRAMLGDVAAAELARQQGAISTGLAEMARAARSANEDIAILQESGMRFMADEAFWQRYELNQAAAAAGDIEAANWVRTVTELMAVKPYLDQALSVPPAVAVGFLNEARAVANASGGGISSDEKRALDAYETAVNQNATESPTNPVGVWYRSGNVDNPVTIDPMGDLASPEMMNALGLRTAHALGAYDVYGYLLPFQPAEVSGFRARLDGAGPEQQAAIFNALLRAMPDDRVFEAAIAQITDNPVAAFAARTMMTDQATGMAILEGQQWLAMPGREQMGRELMDAAALLMKGEVWPAGDGRMEADVLLAAVSYYAATRGKNGTAWNPNDSAALGQAIERVAGDNFQRNGYATFAPPGMSSNRMVDLANNFGWDDMQAAGWAMSGGVPMHARELGHTAIWRQTAPRSSTYVLMLPGIGGELYPVMTEENVPVTVDVNELAARQDRDRHVVDDARAVAQARLDLGVEMMVWTDADGQPLMGPPPAISNEINDAWRDYRAGDIGVEEALQRMNAAVPPGIPTLAPPTTMAPPAAPAPGSHDYAPGFGPPPEAAPASGLPPKPSSEEASTPPAAPAAPGPTFAPIAPYRPPGAGGATPIPGAGGATPIPGGGFTPIPGTRESRPKRAMGGGQKLNLEGRRQSTNVRDERGLPTATKIDAAIAQIQQEFPELRQRVERGQIFRQDELFSVSMEALSDLHAAALELYEKEPTFENQMRLEFATEILSQMSYLGARFIGVPDETTGREFLEMHPELFRGTVGQRFAALNWNAFQAMRAVRGLSRAEMVKTLARELGVPEIEIERKVTSEGVTYTRDNPAGAANVKDAEAGPARRGAKSSAEGSPTITVERFAGRFVGGTEGRREEERVRMERAMAREIAAMSEVDRRWRGVTLTKPFNEMTDEEFARVRFSSLTQAEIGPYIRELTARHRAAGDRNWPYS
jgi:hypothetical protein